MSPTIFTKRGFRFLFFSREESRIHVHVQCPHGEAKFWMEPQIQLAESSGLSVRKLRFIRKTIEERADDILSAWRRHFAG